MIIWFLFNVFLFTLHVGDGTVYSWGYNAEGALGLGAVLGHQSTPHSLTHTLSEILQPEEKVVDVKAGAWHSAIITSMLLSLSRGTTCLFIIVLHTNQF